MDSDIIVIIRMSQRRPVTSDALGKICETFSISESY